MRVKIGKHVDWYGPYQIADSVFFWHKSVKQYLSPDANTFICRLQDWLGMFLAGDDRITTRFKLPKSVAGTIANFCQWLHDHRQRKIKIHVDDYDVWNADYTLALIILPVLKKLKETKQGSPVIDLGDVPFELWPNQTACCGNGYTDDSVHDRWEWVLDEMIWAFEQLVDIDSEEKFYSHITDAKFDVDQDALDAHRDRIQQGLVLFGKYFRGLWD